MCPWWPQDGRGWPLDDLADLPAPDRSRCALAPPLPGGRLFLRSLLVTARSRLRRSGLRRWCAVWCACGSAPPPPDRAGQRRPSAAGARCGVPPAALRRLWTGPDSAGPAPLAREQRACCGCLGCGWGVVCCLCCACWLWGRIPGLSPCGPSPGPRFSAPAHSGPPLQTGGRVLGLRPRSGASPAFGLRAPLANFKRSPAPSVLRAPL